MTSAPPPNFLPLGKNPSVGWSPAYNPITDELWDAKERRVRDIHDEPAHLGEPLRSVLTKLLSTATQTTPSASAAKSTLQQFTPEQVGLLQAHYRYRGLGAEDHGAEQNSSAEPLLAFAADFTFMQGRRPKQEDRHLIVPDLKTSGKLLLQKPLAELRKKLDREGRKIARDNLDHLGSPLALFGVFDGHQGAECSEYVAKRLVPKLVLALASLPLDFDEDSLKTAFTKVFHEIDREWLLKYRTIPDGATAVVSLLMGERLVTAGLGDSRAVEMARNPTTNFVYSQAITNDHKPDDELEQKRVEQAGGKVIELGGVARVAHLDFEERSAKIKRLKAQGLGGQERDPVALAVSRSFGDRFFKEPHKLLSATPEVDVRNVAVNSGIMLSCDGIFDVMENEEVVKLMRKCWPAPRAACGAIVDEAYKRKSMDNLTCICVFFSAAKGEAGDGGARAEEGDTAGKKDDSDGGAEESDAKRRKLEHGAV